MEKNHLVNKKFGKLTIVEIYHPKGKSVRCKCLCECGRTYDGRLYYLETAKVKSCGCLKKERTGNKSLRWIGYKTLPGGIWNKIVSCAKRRGIIIEIDIKHGWKLLIKQNNRCALTGELLNLTQANKSIITASLDRIDSSKGYVEGNVQWVHKDINRMKQEFSQAYFIELCKKVVNHNA